MVIIKDMDIHMVKIIMDSIPTVNMGIVPGIRVIMNKQGIIKLLKYSYYFMLLNFLY